MHKISEIISKSVLTLFEGENAGTVNSFLLDEKQNKIKGFFVFNDESEIVNFIQAKDVFAIGNTCLTIKNLNKLRPSFNLNQDIQIINQEALTIAGDSLGKIKDIYFDNEFSVCSYETSSGVILSPTCLLNIGRDAIFFDIDNINISISKFKPKSKIEIANFPEIKVSILEDEEEKIAVPSKNSQIPIISGNFDESSFAQTKIINNPTIQNKISVPRKQQILFPQKATAASSIVGKTANKTIVGLNGEVVVRDTQKITPEIYEKAKKHSKLFELSSSVE